MRCNLEVYLRVKEIRQQVQERQVGKVRKGELRGSREQEEGLARLVLTGGKTRSYWQRSSEKSAGGDPRQRAVPTAGA